MATVVSESKSYPTSDGRPMAETDLHRDLMVSLIQRLETWFEADQAVYVSGNLLLFYERGNTRRHISPDVFVVKEVGKQKRDNYLIWEEGKGPDFVIEVTSSSTKREDIKKKFALYRDVLKVPEYFLFDPRGDYLKPPLQGYRLVNGEYEPIKPQDRRFRSEELGLYLEQDGSNLDLYDATTGRRLLSAKEKLSQAEAELERLRRENEALRRGS
jgi:Uma2 family endonuclease